MIRRYISIEKIATCISVCNFALSLYIKIKFCMC